jgi:uncharacterized phosphatase
MTIYIVRHGQTVRNVEKKYSGREETPLTAQGLAQAEQAGEFANSLSLSRVVSSPLGRALKTAEVISSRLSSVIQVEIDVRLVERSFGVLEGTHYIPIAGPADLSEYEGVETLDEIYNRALDHLVELRTVNCNMLLVTHGSYSRALLAAAQDGGARMELEGLPNGQIKTLLV